MPLPEPIEQLQRRLVELGCPLKAARKIVRETAEHYEDLQKAAMAEGLPVAESAARAGKLLGNPRQLAERHIEALRNSSVWGRYPALMLGVVPILVMLDLWLMYWFVNVGEVPIAVMETFLVIKSPRFCLLFYFVSHTAVLAMTTLVTAFICTIARQFAVRSRWMWMAGILLSAHGLFLHVSPSRFQWVLLSHLVPTEQADTPLDPSLGPGMYDYISKQRVSPVPAISLWDSGWKVSAVDIQNGIWFSDSRRKEADFLTMGNGVVPTRLKNLMQNIILIIQSPPGHHALSMNGAMVLPMPLIYYSFSPADMIPRARNDSAEMPNFSTLSAAYLSGFLNALNIVMPLLIVAAMLFWQRRAANRAFA